ncbi:PQQ-binding-like beta-propeller repeat protein [Psychromarinibacter sp. C21-152]|uniref:PQQ-binding-like beta-propeller repeat protein n=1 Tax=Psychromarinibacter sediminicola TaxID=3033385 RepID=A0AAE3NS40_9RHOB|nr:PQQ-binding-like beta-propeller repeat protein [Psychromarinibacter sediminicola]MDF0603273.1 PQQ-binding-like beta-propeller repeat protein [Psychromarinibacter sediminicola]
MIRGALIALLFALAAPAQGQTLLNAFLAPATPRALHVPPTSAHQPFPQAQARGLLNFRGNPMRNWYGTGPLPRNPQVLWRVGTFCGPSSEGGETRTWCGTGWTGQPVIRADTVPPEVIFGAYDHSVHFLNAETGVDTRAPFPTGDIIKGSVTLDPTGAPILYFGSRDNHLRAIRLDDGEATELWRLSSITGDGIWNNDWDANPLVLGDVLLTGSENSWFYAVALNRGTDAQGRATVAPTVLNRIPGFTKELFSLVGDRMVSIESSPLVIGDRVYFANSGGLVQGYSIPKLLAGADRAAALTFEYHMGDDVDATLVADAEGFIYAAAENERRDNPAKRASGQLVKLNPAKPDAPRVWALALPGTIGGKGGLWATPALFAGHLYVPTHQGGLYAIDAATGRITWEHDFPEHTWSSPVVIDGELLAPDCSGTISRFSLSNPARPRLIWAWDVPGAGCWESTPAVWDGVIYMGNRNGYFYALGDDPAATKGLTLVELQ